jgi:hypothetical protein
MGEWRECGSLEQLDSGKRVISLFGMGSRIKFVFFEASQNPAAQASVGFAMLKIWAQPLQYFKGIQNTELPRSQSHQRSDDIDRILIENG